MRSIVTSTPLASAHSPATYRTRHRSRTMLPWSMLSDVPKYRLSGWIAQCGRTSATGACRRSPCRTGPATMAARRERQSDGWRVAWRVLLERLGGRQVVRRSIPRLGGRRPGRAGRSLGSGRPVPPISPRRASVGALFQLRYFGHALPASGRRERPEPSCQDERVERLADHGVGRSANEVDRPVVGGLQTRACQAARPKVVVGGLPSSVRPGTVSGKDGKL